MASGFTDATPDVARLADDHIGHHMANIKGRERGTGPWIEPLNEFLCLLEQRFVALQRALELAEIARSQ